MKFLGLAGRSRPRALVVGREAELAVLEHELDASLAGGGRVRFLVGPAGSGKSALLRAFLARARRRARLTVTLADCGSDAATPPWIQTFQQATRRARLHGAAWALVPEWAPLVPVVGKVLSALVSSIAVLRGRGEGHGELGRTDTSAAAVRALLEAGTTTPRLLVLDGLERARPDDLAGAALLLRRIAETRTFLLLACATEGGRLPAPVRDLVLEAERLRRGSELELPPLAPGHVDVLLSRVLGSPAPPEWSAWLLRRSGGLPGPLLDALAELTAAGRLRGGPGRRSFAAPPPAEAPFPQRAPAPGFTSALPPEDRRLLALAALEGETFHVAVVAELAGATELEVEDRLSRLARSGVVGFDGTVAAGDDWTSRYHFVAGADWAACASLLSPEEAAPLRERAGLLGKPLRRLPL